MKTIDTHKLAGILANSQLYGSAKITNSHVRSAVRSLVKNKCLDYDKFDITDYPGRDKLGNTNIVFKLTKSQARQVLDWYAHKVDWDKAIPEIDKYFDIDIDISLDELDAMIQSKPTQYGLKEINPLMEIIQYNGKEYITSQHLHALYKANAGEKHTELKNFNRLIRNIETFEQYKELSEVVELEYDSDKFTSSKIELVFKSTGYKPILLISKVAQIAISHHLDDLFSKAASVSVNTQAAEPKTADTLTIEKVKEAIELGDLLKELKSKHGDDPVIFAALIGKIGINLTPSEPETKPDIERKVIFKFLNASVIAKANGGNAKEFNQLLKDYGYQEKIGTEWVLTKKGEEFGRVFEVKNENGTFQHIRWNPSIIGVIESESGKH